MLGFRGGLPGLGFCGKVSRIPATAGDFAGDLFIEGDELCGALADVAGDGLCLGLPGGPLRGRSTGRAVGDREVFTDIEPRRAGSLNRLTHPRAGRIEI
jgi:hypothetical protein